FQSRIGSSHVGERPARDRHFGELGETEQSGAVAVIDVVIVVGNVVGQRRELRLHRRVSIEGEVLLGAIAEDWWGHRPGRVAGKRAVMLDETLERFPSEVESVETRIFPLEFGHYAQRLGVVVETALAMHGAMQCPLAGMAERRMAKVVRECKRLGKILVDA